MSELNEVDITKSRQNGLECMKHIMLHVIISCPCSPSCTTQAAQMSCTINGHPWLVSSVQYNTKSLPFCFWIMDVKSGLIKFFGCEMPTHPIRHFCKSLKFVSLSCDQKHILWDRSDLDLWPVSPFWSQNGCLCHFWINQFVSGL